MCVGGELEMQTEGEVFRDEQRAAGRRRPFKKREAVCCVQRWVLEDGGKEQLLCPLECLKRNNGRHAVQK